MTTDFKPRFAALRDSEDRYRNMVELSTDAIIDVETTGAPIEFDGRPAVQVALRDVTERKKAEEALKVSEDRLRVATESARMGFWSVDIPSQKWEFSSRAATLFGLPDGRPATIEAVTQQTHPDDRERLADESARALAEAGEHDLEYRVVHPDGQVRWVLLRGHTDMDAEGRPWRNMGIVMDITERKQAEDQGRRAAAEIAAVNAELRESRRAALNLMDDAIAARKQAEWQARFPQENPNPVLRVSLEGDILYANPAAAGNRAWMGGKSGHIAESLRTLVERALAQQAPIEQDVDLGEKTYAVAVAVFPADQKRARQREEEALSLAAASQAAVDVLDAMGEGVLLLEMNGRIASVNPAVEQLAGIPAGELIGRPLSNVLQELLSPEDRALANEALRTALKGQTPELGLMTILSRTGRRIPVIPSVTFVRGAGGRPTAIITTLRDISELRAAQESIEESNVLLERVFDNTHISIAYLDNDFNFVRVNRTYADACGREPNFFSGKNHFALYPHAENEAIFRRVVETGETFTAIEKPFEFADHPEWGVTYWDWTLRPLRGDGNHVESLLYCLLDVTPRVRARQGLVESERKYRELVENANSIIMRITPDHAITFFNEFAQTFFGYTENEVLGKNVVGTIVPEMDSEGRDLRMMVRDVTAQPERYASNENENMRKDGRRVWVHWANRAVCDALGNVTEILCVGTDITRRREMEAEARRYQHRLRELTERLANSEEEDRWRISRYIHDTIIQNLSLSNIRLGSMEKSLNEANLREDVARLRQVRALLGQACDECRTAMSDLTPALLYELGLIPALHDLAHRLQPKHEARMVVEDDGRDVPLSNPLRGLLFDSVRELVMNALKYAGPCEIRVAVNGSDDALTISVADNGIGFDPGSDVRRDHQGSFGLFNIRQRLEGLNGRLDITSAPGKGTTVTIRMPMSTTPCDEA